MLILLFISVCLITFANGANDNFKGVASLYGSGAASYRFALFWASITTFFGSLCALYLAQTLLISFSGKGLVNDALVQSIPFMTAVACGAGLTVILASRLGFPVSTTHALIGAMVGSGMLASMGNMDLTALQQKFVWPLLISPMMAVLLSMILYGFFKQLGKKLRFNQIICLCVKNTAATVAQSGDMALMQSNALELNVSDTQNCTESFQRRLFDFNLDTLLDKLHFVSAGAVCFARGLNDTPKIAGLLLLAPGLNIQWVIFMIAVVMALGGIIYSFKVAETMAYKITQISRGQGFAANLCTSILVIYASRLGVPVSTTHVSVGALFGIGLSNGKADYQMIGSILMSWFLTLPFAACSAALVYRLMTG